MSFPRPLLGRLSFFRNHGGAESSSSSSVYVTEFDREATLNKYVAAKLEASFSTFEHGHTSLHLQYRHLVITAF